MRACPCVSVARTQHECDCGDREHEGHARGEHEAHEEGVVKRRVAQAAGDGGGGGVGCRDDDDDDLGIG